MRLLDSEIRLSASDLSNHLGCRHLTWLDLRAATGKIEPPDHHDPRLEALIERGFQHEAAFLDHLEGKGRVVTRLPKADDTTSGTQQTIAAMQAGTEVIVQATLTSGRWLGYADVLLRVETPSDLGAWSYEVLDTKLARETRAGTILQLSLYSDIVGELQGTPPEHMHVVSPGRDFEPETHRVDDYAAYYRHVRRRLEEAVAELPSENNEPCYPEPVAQCDICRWWADCRDRRRADDHLSLVAGISRLQVRELEERGTTTVAKLAEVPVPLGWKPRRGSRMGLENVREQARVQIAGRKTGAPVHEFLPLEPDRGFARLPAPSPGDIFFDIEGGRFVGEHGLEYLLAFVHEDGGNGSADKRPTRTNGPTYEHRWAFDAAGERQAFEWLVDTVIARWAVDPTMHIYHYAPYEPSALKRLMGRYATREDEVDRMLRGGLFVDLFHIVRQAVRASVESYSIKELERFYGFARSVDLRDAGQALRRVEHMLELGEALDTEDNDLAAVLGYNTDDCVSTLHLRGWLEQLRAEYEKTAGEPIARPAPSPAEPSDAVDERQQRVNAMKARLLENVPPDPAERNEADQARALLAEMLDFHRREFKAPWWEYFHLLDLTDLELLDDKAALAGLEFVQRVGGTKKCPIDRYEFPQQDTDIRRGDELHLVTGADFGTVDDVDRVARRIDVKKRGASKDIHPTAFFAHSVVKTAVLADSLLRFADRIAKHGVDASDAHTAATELLQRRPPTLTDDAPLNLDGEKSLAGACRVVTQLDDCYLPIQGPPGAGKTFTGAHMITELVRAGKKVGVTAVSHKVIRNLLDKAIEVSGGDAVCGHKVGQGADGDAEASAITDFTDNKRPLEALTEGQINVLGGTAWLWARGEFEQSVDVLFVDEAGQMALANVLAVAAPHHLRFHQRGVLRGPPVLGPASVAAGRGHLGDPRFRPVAPARGAFRQSELVDRRSRCRRGPRRGPARRGAHLDRRRRRSPPAPPRRYPHRGTLQRSGNRHRRAHPRCQRGHRRQVPGPGGTDCDLLHGDFLAGRCPPRHGVSTAPIASMWPRVARAAPAS
jgi:uncharacterized protein